MNTLFSVLLSAGPLAFLAALVAVPVCYGICRNAADPQRPTSLAHYLLACMGVAAAAYCAGALIGIFAICSLPGAGNLCGLAGIFGAGPLFSAAAIFIYIYRWARRMRRVPHLSSSEAAMDSINLMYRFASAWREGIRKVLQRIVAAVLAVVAAGLLLGSGTARSRDAVPGASSAAAVSEFPAIVPATAAVFGLYQGADFRLVKGDCEDCATPKQALWYFRDDLVAVPVAGVKSADFARGVEAQEDVRRWYATAGEDDLQARPPMLWIGAPSLVRDVRLSAGGDTLTLGDGANVPFSIVPKINSNRSYYNDSSREYFQQRAVRLRGGMQGGTFVARTMWPRDWVIDETQMKLQPLRAGESVMGLVRTHASAKNERFETRLLWEKSPGAASNAVRDGSGRAVIGIILNGAQGDDDEAHGGHFAIATGRIGNGSEMADWLVNNFYNLGSFSEKGITAAMLPLDNYMTDLNSGQSWYRPSYMLVAVLKSDRAAYAYQGAIARVYHHFYRHDFEYRHAGANCAGISMDTLRTLGWTIPAQGATSMVKAIAAYPYKSVADFSFTSGKQSYDYMIEERTRLYPAAAFDAAGRDLLRIAGVVNSAGGSVAAGRLENILRDDIEAIVFVRLPQIPSSRAFGSFPVASYDEYMARVPADKSKWKIVPVDARPFPPELIEPDTLREWQTPPWAPALGGLALVASVLSIRSVRRWRAREAAVKLY